MVGELKAVVGDHGKQLVATRYLGSGEPQ